jgi:hypothetical protein
VSNLAPTFHFRACHSPLLCFDSFSSSFDNLHRSDGFHLTEIPSLSILRSPSKTNVPYPELYQPLQTQHHQDHNLTRLVHHRPPGKKLHTKPPATMIDVPRRHLIGPPVTHVLPFEIHVPHQGLECRLGLKVSPARSSVDMHAATYAWHHHKAHLGLSCNARRAWLVFLFILRSFASRVREVPVVLTSCDKADKEG